MARSRKRKKQDLQPPPRELTEAELQANRESILEALSNPSGFAGGGTARDFELAAPEEPGGIAGFIERTAEEIRNAGRDINRAAIAAGEGVRHLKNEILKVGDKLGSEFEKGMCDLFAPNGGCSISVGAGHDAQGPYTFDPSNPDQKYRPTDTTDDGNIQRMIDNAKYLETIFIEEWEAEDEDEYKVKRFLEPGAKLGSPWPNAESETKPPTASGKVRPCGSGGCGDFMAIRKNPDGTLRFHAGVDYLATPGEQIRSPLNGVVVGRKNPGRPGLEGLLIRTESGHSATIFYITPDAAMKRGTPVTAGVTVIGTAQSLHPAYPANVPNHVHVTLADKNGNAVAPDGKQWVIKRTPKTRKDD